MSSSTRIRNNSNVYWKISECNASDVSFSASWVDSELLFTFFRFSWGIEKKEISLRCTLKCSEGNGRKKVEMKRTHCREMFKWICDDSNAFLNGTRGMKSSDDEYILIWFSKECCFPMISSSCKTWIHQIQSTSKASAQFNPLFHSSLQAKSNVAQRVLEFPWISLFSESVVCLSFDAKLNLF